jgi:formate dehydrogenase gamma subunit
MSKKTFVLIITAVLLSFIFGTGTTSAQTPMKNEDCLNCHADKGIEAETERGKKLNLLVPADALKGSTHEDVSCVDCHVGAKSFEEIPHADKPLEFGCASCHEEAKLKEGKDIHDIAQKAGNPRAPHCYSCHGGHQILPLTSPESRFAKLKQPDTCGKCHGDDKLIDAEKAITKRNLVLRYKTSIHWEALVQGKNAASCTDCHGTHNILSSATELSKVSRVGVANSCQLCHPIEAKSFWTGAHGTSLLYGNTDVPTCITCHGDHDMASLRTRVGDAKQWASTQVCIWCHGNARMMARYGLDTAPVDSYMEDFHGLTQRGTLGASATCSDCHDPHHSLPSTHPSSRMHISNRGPTCGKCHGKVSESFAMSFTHRKAVQREGLKIENLVRTIYILIIIFAVAGMLFYNFLVWLKALREKMKKQRQSKLVKRMNRFERSTHMVMFITFTILVITGFALKYPETFWAKWLFAIGVQEANRAFIHRFAALVMTFDCIIFGIYMLFVKRGKCLTKEIWPRKKDIGEFWANFKYYLGVSKETHPPKRGIFNFVEKFEFWALIWGTFVMVVTGLILWFPKAIPGSWPAWIINVARIIHFYEAVLATLAIIIWHGFHTMFHPAEFPMNTSWLTGYISEEEAKAHFTDDAVEQMKK